MHVRLRRFFSGRKAAVTLAAMFVAGSLSFLTSQPAANAACRWDSMASYGVTVYYSGCDSYLRIERITIVNTRRPYVAVSYAIYRSTEYGGRVVTKQGRGALNKFGTGHFEPRTSTHVKYAPMSVYVSVGGSSVEFGGIR